MCCSELIKTFDFLPERACLWMRAHARICVCVPGKNNRTCASAHAGGMALGLLRRYLFSPNLVILITVHIYLHFLFVSALDSHLRTPLPRLFSLTNDDAR